MSSIPKNFSQLVDFLLSASAAATPNSISSASNNIPGNAQIVSNRIMLEKHARGFHSEAGTLSSNTEDSMSFLHDPETIVLASTHQPNLLPYSGVVKKIVLMETLKHSLLEKLDGTGRKVVSLFMIIDQEFADDKWICHAELPSVNHDKGILGLSLGPAKSDRRRMVRNVRKPAPSVLSHWKKQVSSWVLENACAISTDEGSSVGAVPRSVLRRSQYYINFEEFWVEVEYAYSKSESLSDFNAFLLSRVVNSAFGYGTLFVRLTEMSVVVQNGIKYLLSNFDKYSGILESTEQKLMQYGINTRVGSNVLRSAPVWLHCQCGSKASVTLTRDGGNLGLSGKCINCGKQLERSLGRADDPDLSQTISELSLRAIPIPLLLSRDLGTSCYVTGTGGVGYLIDAAAISRGLSIPFPTIALWAGRDYYDGIAQRAALKFLNIHEASQIRPYIDRLQHDYAVHANMIEELVQERSKRIKEGMPLDDLLHKLFGLKEKQRSLRSELRQAQRALGATNLSPCFIDYVVNFGMMRAANEWRHYLEYDGDLIKPLKMIMAWRRDAASSASIS
jgi:hypothetical protein